LHLISTRQTHGLRWRISGRRTGRVPEQRGVLKRTSKAQAAVFNISVNRSSSVVFALRCMAAKWHQYNGSSEIMASAMA